ncbi:hypothetical protein GCM10010203_46880 [Actinomadura yumaensis]
MAAIGDQARQITVAGIDLDQKGRLRRRAQPSRRRHPFGQGGVGPGRRFQPCDRTGRQFAVGPTHQGFIVDVHPVTPCSANVCIKV